MSVTPLRVILIDTSVSSREVIVRRLGAQGFKVETTDDAAAGANLALANPPAAVVADLWMPNISGIQLSRLLKAEPATADVPVILRGEDDDPRSLFWTERSGAAAYVRKGRTGELVRVLGKSIKPASERDAFFMQLPGSGIDIRDRIARHLDVALFESVVAAEVRSLASAGSFDRLFDLLAQFVCQILDYRWLAVHTTSSPRFALHAHPAHAGQAECEARKMLGLANHTPTTLRVIDDDARGTELGPPAIVKVIPFGASELGSLALAPSGEGTADRESLVELIARELGGPIRIADLMDEQQLLASVDSLTGLRNRRVFVEAATIEVARALRYGTALSLLLLDVDHFKSINDNHGHAAGDRVLSTLGTLLPRQVRTPDLPARWGGEEFIVLLPNTTVEGASVVAERIRLVVETGSSWHERCSVRVTVSIGVAALKRGEALDSLIDRADKAMYQAKQNGRNRIVIAEPELPPRDDGASWPEDSKHGSGLTQQEYLT